MSYTLLSYHKNCSLIAQQNGRVMAKKFMPIYGINGILRAISIFFNATYLLDKYHQITYSLQFSAQYHFLTSRIFIRASYVLSYNSGYNKYLSTIILGVIDGNCTDINGVGPPTWSLNKYKTGQRHQCLYFLKFLNSWFY